MYRITVSWKTQWENHMGHPMEQSMESLYKAQLLFRSSLLLPPLFAFSFSVLDRNSDLRSLRRKVLAPLPITVCAFVFYIEKTSAHSFLVHPHRIATTHRARRSQRLIPLTLVSSYTARSYSMRLPGFFSNLHSPRYGMRSLGTVPRKTMNTSIMSSLL